VRYSSRRVAARARPARFTARYGPIGPVFQATTGSLEYFLTERYCLHTVDPRGRPLTVDIHHPPWPLQAAEAEIPVNDMMEPLGVQVWQVGPEPLLHFSRRQDTVAWAPARIELRRGP
jgi:hypothetical protein